MVTDEKFVEKLLRPPRRWWFWIFKNLVSGRLKKILRTIGSLLDTWSEFTTFCQGPSIKNCETSNCPSKEFYQKNATNFTTRATNFEIRRFHVREVKNLRSNFGQKKFIAIIINKCLKNVKSYPSITELAHVLTTYFFIVMKKN